MSEKKASLRFWKWTLLVFLAARSSDVVQAVLSLWVVPSCVSAEDLGAVLPMLETAKVLALPLAILVIPFSRWLAICTARGERGKVKSLLRLMLPGSVAAVALMGLAAWLFLPGIARFSRVSEEGFSSVLVAAGALTALSPVFNRALQGLRKFGTVAVAGVAGAGVRLAVSLALVPVRAIGGYMAGLSVEALVQISLSWFGMRREFSFRGEAVPFWRGEGREMWRYTVPVAVTTVIWCLISDFQAIAVRCNLTDAESAAYFIVTRFGDIGQWVGMSLLFVAFPVIACEQARGRDHLKVLSVTVYGTLAAGTAVGLAFLLVGPSLLESVPVWRDYRGYSGYIALYIVRFAMGAAVGAFMSCEQAAGNFRYLAYLVPCVAVESAGLLMLHRLDHVLWWMTVTVAVQTVIVVAILLRRNRAAQA